MLKNLIGSKICGGNPAGTRSVADFYPTPPEATQALLNFLNLEPGTTVWEPACGDGHMVKVLESNDLLVRATDITLGVDFLTTEDNTSQWIITNPPFSIADKFIRKCAEYHVPFALLLKSQYWHASRRLCLFREIQPSYVLPLTWRPDFCFKERGGGSPVMDVLWCVWEPGVTHTTYIPLERPQKVGE